MARKKDPIEYDVNVRLYGLPAYAIQKMVDQGLWGQTEEEVVRTLVSQGVVREFRSGLLGHLGITLDGAKEENYIPVKPDPEPEED